MSLDAQIQRLDDALKLFLEVTDRELPELVNKKLKWVLREAIDTTPAVRPDQISAELRWQYLTLAFFKNGKRRKRPKAFYKFTTLARSIIIARLRKKGHNPRAEAVGEIDKMIENMISRRRSGSAFLKSGWIPGLKALGGGNVSDVPFRNANGSGFSATAESPVAEAVNTVATPWTSDTPGYQKAARALEQAFALETESTLDELDKRLNEAWQSCG